MEELKQMYEKCKSESDYLDFIVKATLIDQSLSDWQELKDGWSKKLDLAQFANFLIGLAKDKIKSLKSKTQNLDSDPHFINIHGKIVNVNQVALVEFMTTGFNIDEDGYYLKYAVLTVCGRTISLMDNELMWRESQGGLELAIENYNNIAAQINSLGLPNLTIPLLLQENENLCFGQSKV